MEANAEKVERRVQKSAAAQLLAHRIGQSFDGIITGAADKGDFVRVLAPTAEGKTGARRARPRRRATRARASSRRQRRQRVHRLRARGRRGRETRMTLPRSDALVFFGATGDLAYKKIFPALQALARRGGLKFPSSAWPSQAGRAISSSSAPAPASASTAALDQAAFAKLVVAPRVRRRRLQRRGDVRRAQEEARRRRAPRCTTSPFRRACSRR